MLDELLHDIEDRMQKSLQILQHEMGKIRTGRAHSSLLEEIKVSCYGDEMPLAQTASISVLDARTLNVMVWDKSLIAAVEKAILNSDLGLNPMIAGETIRVPLPPLTEDRRKELIRVIRQSGEKARVAIRNLRREANQLCKDQVKEKLLTEDELRQAESQIQTFTDNNIAKVDILLKNKEQETMEV